jgi:E3 ubiquitin-protein ligase RGLG
MSTEMSQAEKEEQFALEALKKIPAQYAEIINQQIRYCLAIFRET